MGVISYTLVLTMASGIVPMAGVSHSGGTLPAFQLTGSLGPPASYPMVYSGMTYRLDIVSGIVSLSGMSRGNGIRLTGAIEPVASHLPPPLPPIRDLYLPLVIRQ